MIAPAAIPQQTTHVAMPIKAPGIEAPAPVHTLSDTQAQKNRNGIGNTINPTIIQVIISFSTLHQTATTSVRLHRQAIFHDLPQFV